MKVPKHYKMTDRALREETGLTKEKPVRSKNESDTYWNTRSLAHSVKGEHYRTPQANMNMLIDYLNESSKVNKEVTGFSFVAGTTENLRFKTQTGVISFNAHQPINKNDFLRAFM